MSHNLLKYEVLSMTLDTSLIICLGAGIVHKRKRDPAYLWIGQESLYRAAAAAVLWKKNPKAVIIFSGGKPAGTTSPSEAETMSSYVMRSPWNIPASSIFKEETSIDTASNVRNTVYILQEKKIQTSHCVLVAGARHVDRAVSYFQAYGIRVTPRLSRDVLARTWIDMKIPPEIVSKTDRRRELLLQLEQWIDPKGYLITWLKNQQIKLQSPEK